MASGEFEVNIEYINGTVAQYIMHDNNIIEIVDIPKLTTRYGTDARLDMLSQLCDFARKYDIHTIKMRELKTPKGELNGKNTEETSGTSSGK